MFKNKIFNSFKNTKKKSIDRQISILKESKNSVGECEEKLVIYYPSKKMREQLESCVTFKERYDILKIYRNRYDKGVFLVIDKNTEEKYICRSKKKNKTTDNEMIVANILLNVKNSLIANYISFFETDELVYFIIEYIEGVTLHDLHISGNILRDEVPIYIYKTVKCLEYIHSLGIVHCDIKPDNIMVTKNKDIKIIDFDMAIYGEAKFKNIFGTENYLAPESYDLGIYGFKSDVWGLGIVFYNLLVNDKPTTCSLPLKHSGFNLYRRNEFKHIDIDNTKLDDNMCKLISGMLCFDCDRRSSSSVCREEFEKYIVNVTS